MSRDKDAGLNSKRERSGFWHETGHCLSHNIRLNHVMKRLTLRGTSLETSVAGFGCVGLTAVEGENRAIELLHRAHDLGITHFDVAPLYGMGRAEHILGRFLQGRRSNVTVATKFGLAPPPMVARSGSIVPTVKKLLRRFPPADRLVRNYRARSVRTHAFTAVEAEASLHASLLPG